MTIQDAIENASWTTKKIRLKRWLPECFCYVENGYIRQEHNETQTGRPKEFSIDELLSQGWEVYQEQIKKVYVSHYHSFGSRKQRVKQQNEIKHNCLWCRFISGVPRWNCILLAEVLQGHYDDKQVVVIPHERCPIVIYFNAMRGKQWLLPENHV